MKKILLILFVFNNIITLAQNKVAQKVLELQTLKASFKQISILTPAQNEDASNINKIVDGATLASVNLEKINDVVSNQHGTIELEIPYQNQNISVLLYKINPFAEGFHVDSNQKRNIPYQKGVYYRGIIKGETNSVAAFNFFNGEFNGILSSSNLGNVVVAKLNKPNNQTNYIVYSDAKMKVLNPFACQTKDSSNDMPPSSNKSVNSTRCATFYFEVDNNLFVQNGSDTTTTTNWMTSVFNNVQTLYNNDGITVSLKSIYIWTTQDPYEGIGTSSSDYLQAFNSQTPVFDGDVGQLVGIDPGGLGGVAVAINGLCSQNNYSYADVNFSYNIVPTFSWTVEVVTHEFGHLLGSPHTHGCYWNGNNTAIDGCGPTAGSQYAEGTCAIGPIPTSDVKGTIMSYCHLLSGVGISFNNGFGPQPAALLLSRINNSACLSTDCVNTCVNLVVDIATTNITLNSALISWNDLGTSTAWQVAVTPFSSSNIVWNTVTTNSFLATDLTANAYYKIRVRPFCDGLTPLTREKIFATNGNYCTGMTFTDTGGATGNYTDMESWTRTMTPYNSGLKLKVTFTSFNLENAYDFLYIYNGPDETFSTLATLTGTTNPGSFTSTSSEGSLTFKFYSDQGVNAAGWKATITCTGTLGEISNDFIDYSYYPNPTNGKLYITSKDVVTEVTLYNVTGQLLYNQKPNEISTNIDMTSFANGTYFVKLKFNDKEANFKILKN